MVTTVTVAVSTVVQSGALAADTTVASEGTLLSLAVVGATLAGALRTVAVTVVLTLAGVVVVTAVAMRAGVVVMGVDTVGVVTVASKKAQWGSKSCPIFNSSGEVAHQF
jgi:hypothetical protein